MDLYFLVGNALHLISVLYLLAKLLRARLCEGVSGKTQLLFFIAYVTRSMNVLLACYDSVFSAVGQLIYVALHFITVLLIFIGFKNSYKWTEDMFLTEWLMWTCVTLAMWFNDKMSAQEITYAFSMFLESLAILPQLYMIRKRREMEKSLLHYLILVGLDRLVYLLYWLFRSRTENYLGAVVNTTGCLHLTVCFVALVLFYDFRVKVKNVENDKHSKKNIIIV